MRLREPSSSWQGRVGLDLAVVFDAADCGLKCFYVSEWDEEVCDRGTDCFGIYRIQNGLNGFVWNAGVLVEKIHPCMVVWRRENHSKYSILDLMIKEDDVLLVISE
jgi:hypothetical protein